MSVRSILSVHRIISIHSIGLLFLFASLSAQAEQVEINWEAGDRLAVTAAQTYCWMFTNPAQNPTVITLNLQLNPD